jgi:K+-sensing histidine kinase KdpD
MTDLQHQLALLDACRAVGEPVDLTETLNRAMVYAVILTKAERGLLTLYNKTTKGFDVRTAHNISGGEALEERKARADAVAQSGQSSLVADEGRDLRTSMTIPLQARGRTVGAVYVEKSCSSGSFSHNDLAYFETFVAQAANAIEGKISKADFVSVVTHELRLPMTTMKGYADLIRSGAVGPVTDQQKQFLTTIRAGVDRMNALLSDLSDISKIETGRLKLEIKAVDAADCARAAAEALTPQIEEKGQTLALNISDQLPPVQIDRARLMQIIANLLSNAHSYTPADGTITLIAETFDQALRIRVGDTGVGIPADEQPKVFTQFFRGESEAVRDQPGWGLALHLSKRLVEMFGGRIGFESEPGKGSTFWFTIPIDNS